MPGRALTLVNAGRVSAGEACFAKGFVWTHSAGGFEVVDPFSLTVRDLMSTDVVTVGRNDTLREAEAAMGERRIRHLPVLDENGRLCGIITQRDLFRGALLRALGYGSRAEEMMLDGTVVKEAMREAPITTAADAPLHTAAALMVEHQVGCLPVLDGRDLIGILSEGDFVRLAMR